MALTKTQIIAQVKKNLGNRGNLETTDILIWLNWAMRDTASIRNWRIMQILDQTSVQTRIGAHWYALPPEVKDILGYVHYDDETQSRTLTYKQPHVFRRLWPHPESDGQNRPEFYTIEGSYLKLYPIPNEARKLHIFCAKWPIPFDVNSDEECPLGDLDQAIICLATSYGARQHKDWERMTVHKKDYIKLCKQYARIDGPPSDWTPQYASERIARQVSGSGLVVPALNNSNPA